MVSMVCYHGNRVFEPMHAEHNGLAVHRPNHSNSHLVLHIHNVDLAPTVCIVLKHVIIASSFGKYYAYTYALNSLYFFLCHNYY